MFENTEVFVFLFGSPKIGVCAILLIGVDTRDQVCDTSHPAAPGGDRARSSDGRRNMPRHPTVP